MDWNLFKKLVLPEHFAVLIGHFDENFKKGKLSPGKPFISSRSLKLSLELFDYWLLSLVLPTSQQWLQILSPPSRSRWIFLRRRSTKGSSQRGWKSWTRAKLAPTRGVRFQVSSIVLLIQFKNKILYFLGIFPKLWTPPPFGNPLVENFLWFILHFRP